MPNPPITPSTDLVMPSRSYSDLNVSAAKPRVSNHEGYPSFETTAAQPPQDEGGTPAQKKGPKRGPGVKPCNARCQTTVFLGSGPCAISRGFSTSYQTFFLVKYIRPARTIRKIMT